MIYSMSRPAFFYSIEFWLNNWLLWKHVTYSETDAPTHRQTDRQKAFHYYIDKQAHFIFKQWEIVFHGDNWTMTKYFSPNLFKLSQNWLLSEKTTMRVVLLAFCLLSWKAKAKISDKVGDTQRCEWIKDQPSCARALLHRLQNPKWSPGGPKMVLRVWKGVNS